MIVTAIVFHGGKVIPEGGWDAIDFFVVDFKKDGEVVEAFDAGKFNSYSGTDRKVWDGEVEADELVIETGTIHFEGQSVSVWGAKDGEVVELKEVPLVLGDNAFRVDLKPTPMWLWLGTAVGALGLVYYVTRKG